MFKSCLPGFTKETIFVNPLPFISENYASELLLYHVQVRIKSYKKYKLEL